MSYENKLESTPITFGRYSLTYHLNGRENLNDDTVQAVYLDHEAMVDDFNRLHASNPRLTMSVQERNDFTQEISPADKTEYSKLQAHFDLVKKYVAENRTDISANYTKH